MVGFYFRGRGQLWIAKTVASERQGTPRREASYGIHCVGQFRPGSVAKAVLTIGMAVIEATGGHWLEWEDAGINSFWVYPVPRCFKSK